MDPRAACLTADLIEARGRTLALFNGLNEDQKSVPLLAIVNPPRWEVGHIAWFQEHWTLRHLGHQRPAREDGDALFDSSRVHHDSRWEIPVPSSRDTRLYMEGILHRVLARLESADFSENEEYFHRLVLFHEDMHGEALLYTRQTLGYSGPDWAQ